MPKWPIIWCIGCSFLSGNVQIISIEEFWAIVYVRLVVVGSNGTTQPSSDWLPVKVSVFKNSGYVHA
jgi:hypothetical protein